MKILMVGSGAREHALIWKLKQSPKVTELFCAPGNGGMSAIAKTVDIDVTDINGLRLFAKKEKIDLTVVGPEVPLSLGIVDAFETDGLHIIGVRKKEAELESSKVFSKNLLLKYNIPTAKASIFDSYEGALQYIQNNLFPLVIKADGLAQGKGVKICQNISGAEAVLHEMMVKKSFGLAGEKVVIEEFLQGEEVSLIGFMDGEYFSACPSVQDYKKIGEGDTGDNTGGMGAYSPVPWYDAECEAKVHLYIIEPLLRAFKQEGLEYKGILYVGLLFAKGRPHVLEFNVRFGDPETQVLMMRLQTDLVDVFQALLRGKLKTTSLEWDPRPAVCVVLASKGYPGPYQTGFEIQGLEENSDHENVALFHAATVLKGKKILTNGGRVMTCSAVGHSYQEAIDQAYRVVKKIHWENMVYRRDIGKKLCQK